MLKYEELMEKKPSFSKEFGTKDQQRIVNISGSSTIVNKRLLTGLMLVRLIDKLTRGGFKKVHTVHAHSQLSIFEDIWKLEADGTETSSEDGANGALLLIGWKEDTVEDTIWCSSKPAGFKDESALSFDCVEVDELNVNAD